MARAKAAPLDEKLIRSVRRILDAREYDRPRKKTDDDWTLSELLALGIPFEDLARMGGKQLGSWHRVNLVHRLWASLPGIAPADDSLRRSCNSTDKDKRMMALAAVGWGGRTDLDAEVAKSINPDEIGTWPGNAAIDAAMTLQSRECLVAILELTKKKVKQLESKTIWLCSWDLLRSLRDYETRDAEPFFRRYFPTIASDSKLKEEKHDDHRRLAAWGLARLGDEEALAWLAAQMVAGRTSYHCDPVCDVLGWSVHDEAEVSAIVQRWEARERGEATTCPFPLFPRKEAPAPSGTIAELDKVISENPADRMARLRRGNLCFDAGQYPRAMHDYSACLRLDDRVNDETPLRLWLVRSALRLRAFADVSLRRWLRANGERLDPHRLRVARHLAGELAIDELTGPAETPEDRIEAWFFAGARALFVGDSESGRRGLERCLTAVTTSPSSEQVSARALLEANR